MIFEIILGIAILLIASLAWRDYARQKSLAPRLVYMILPPYEVPEMIVAGGVVVENRGGAPANEIRIALAYPDERAQRIRHLQVLSDVEYVQEAGGENETFVKLRVQQLAPNQKLIVYFSGLDRLLPRVTVTQGVEIKVE